MSPRRSLFHTVCGFLLVFICTSFLPHSPLPLQAAPEKPPSSVNAGLAWAGPFDPQATRTLTAVADAYVDSSNATVNYGTGTSHYVGSLDPGHIGRALVRFDLSSLNGATIQSASLELNRTSGSTSTASINVSIFRISGAWSESGVNWSNQPAALTINKINPVGMAAGYYGWEVTGLVQDWVNGTVPNYGVMLRAASETIVGWRGFSSREVSAAPPRLVVNYTPGTSVGDAQAQGLFRLQSNSSVPLRARFRSGIPAYIHATVPSGGITGDLLSQARAYLSAYKDLYRLTDPATQFRFSRRILETSRGHLYLQQIYAGIPVYGAELGLHFSGNLFNSSNGAYLSDLKLSTQPALTAGQAEALAMAHALAESPGAPMRTAGQTGLVIFDRSLWANVASDPHLAWQVNLQAPRTWTYFVDAQSGTILRRLSQDPTGLDLEVFTGNNDWSGWPCWTFPDDPSTLWFTEDGREVPNEDINADGRNGYANIQDIYTYWRDAFSRRSYDNDDAQIEVVVNVNHVAQFGSANAVWRGCDMMETSPGWAQLDVMGHEFTHGVVSDEYDPEYEDESGAVNESLADTFGEFFEFAASGSTNWLVGASITGRANALRSMSNPSAAPYGDPDRLSLYFITDDDFGGVHRNSGIPNKAAWLIANGAVNTFNNIQVSGLSIAQSELIFYRALSHYLAGNAGFPSLREAMINAAEDIYGIASAQVCTVRNAYAAVEVGDPDINCDGVESSTDLDDDSDRVSNDQDNCPTVPNPGQSNVDGDNFGDACDGDDDGDHLMDSNDNCVLVANPSQLDSDHNNVGDACDDPDHDGIANRRADDSLWDNCPLVGNFSQFDFDNDGLGDECDPDSDNDGILDDGDGSGTRGDHYCSGGNHHNCDDNAPFAANFAQTDADSDGVGDVADNCLGTANPYAVGIYPPIQADTDGDGNGDACDADLDNDGVPNATDNCLYVPNPDQINLNQNMIGLKCDQDEAFMLSSDAQMASLFFRFQNLSSPLVLPLFPCWGTCPDENSLLPAGQRAFVSLQMPAGFGLRVLDEHGALVKRGQRGATYAPISFEVNPGLRSPVLNLLAPIFPAAPRAALASGRPQTPSYFLEIWPGSTTVIGQTYSAKFDLSSFVDKNHIYLPSLRK